MDRVSEYMKIVTSRHQAALSGETPINSVDDLNAIYKHMTEEEVIELDVKWRSYLDSFSEK